MFERSVFTLAGNYKNIYTMKIQVKQTDNKKININHISDYKIIIDKIKSKKLLSCVRYSTIDSSLRNIRVIYGNGVKLYKVVMTNNKNKK